MAIEVDSILDGTVTGIKPFGAFVALPEGKSGLVHISEVSYEFVQDLSTVLQVGQPVKVKVISISPDGKIALSIKRLAPPPQRPAPRGDRREAGHSDGGHGEGNRSSRPPRRDYGKDGDSRPQRRSRDEAPRVWQPKAQPSTDNMSFEDMMSRFKTQSEAKLSELDLDNGRRGNNNRRRR